MKSGRIIHKRVIQRLLIAWAALSIVIGGVVFYLELRKAEDLVLRLAIEESESFTARNLYHFNRPGADPLLRQKAEEFLKRHFILIRLYNRNKQGGFNNQAQKAQRDAA